MPRTTPAPTSPRWWTDGSHRGDRRRPPRAQLPPDHGRPATAVNPASSTSRARHAGDRRRAGRAARRHPGLGDVFDHPPAPDVPARSGSALCASCARSASTACSWSPSAAPRHAPPARHRQPVSALADTSPSCTSRPRMHTSRSTSRACGSTACRRCSRSPPRSRRSSSGRQPQRDRSNLLITHPRLTQLRPRYDDINELEVDLGTLKSDFVLLGHYQCTRRSTTASGRRLTRHVHVRRRPGSADGLRGARPRHQSRCARAGARPAPARPPRHRRSALGLSHAEVRRRVLAESAMVQPCDRRPALQSTASTRRRTPARPRRGARPRRRGHAHQSRAPLPAEGRPDAGGGAPGHGLDGGALGSLRRGPDRSARPGEDRDPSATSTSRRRWRRRADADNPALPPQPTACSRTS